MRYVTDHKDVVVLSIAWVLVFMGMLEWLDRRANR